MNMHVKMPSSAQARSLSATEAKRKTKTKRNKTTASIKAVAALEFEAIPEFRKITDADDRCREKHMQETLIGIRFAIRTLSKTKPEMIKMFSSMDQELAQTLVEHLQGTQRMLDAYLEAVRAAEVRCLVAMSALLEGDTRSAA